MTPSVPLMEIITTNTRKAANCSGPNPVAQCC